MINADTRAFQALRQLIKSELDEESSGRYVGLRAFIDPGRGDIYVEGINGHRIYLAALGESASYITGDGKYGERTEIVDNP